MELFLLIGQASNRAVLTKLNYVVAWNKDKKVTYTLGLWNYCKGNAKGVIQNCAKGHAAYNWANTPDISKALSKEASSDFINSLFIANFSLIFIACGLSFVFFIFSLPVCFSRRRVFGASMTTLVFINFLAMLAALILSLVLIIGGIKRLYNEDSAWNAHAGNSLWISIGACVALFIAFLSYSCGTAGGKHKSNRTDPNVKEGSFGFGLPKPNHMSPPMVAGPQSPPPQSPPPQMMQKPPMAPPQMNNNQPGPNQGMARGGSVSPPGSPMQGVPIRGAPNPGNSMSGANSAGSP